MSQAPVSVVIPTFNSAGLVTQALDSVLAQTVAPAQIIVVDDGSQDDTRQRLAAYRDRIEYVYQENQGVAAARNRGVARATRDFVAFLDADDIWHPSKLAIQLAVIGRNPSLGLLGTETFDAEAPVPPPVAAGEAYPISQVPWERLVVRNYFVTSSLLVRRGVLEQAGPFDTSLQGPEDHDLWLRVAEVAAAANIELPLTGYRLVPGSLSQQAVRMRAGMQRILQKLDERQAWQGRWLLRRKAHSYCDYSCAYMHGAAGNRGVALANLLRSLAWYPLPYRRDEALVPLARPRRLAVLLLRLLRLKQPDGVASPSNHASIHAARPTDVPTGLPSDNCSGQSALVATVNREAI